MKKQDLLLSMNLIDDKYITEAGGNALKQMKRRKKLIKLGVIAAVTLALCLFMFIPYSTKAPGLKGYADSEYYEVIEKLNQYFYTPPKFKNNFEALTYGLTAAFRNGMKFAAPEAAADGMNESIGDNGTGNYLYATSTDSDYQEVTDNQVKGVIEGDLFKRSDKYIYYLDGGTVKIYSIDGKDSKLINSYELQTYTRGTGNLMYLSQDCTTLTIIFNDYIFSTDDDTRESTFSVLSLDVTDPENIKMQNQRDYYGTLFSARMVDGKLYLISGFMAKDKNGFDNKRTYVPYTSANGKTEFVSEECIYVPDELSGAGYAVMMRLDEKSLEKEGEYALLSFYNPVIYVNKSSIYLARSFYETAETPLYTSKELMSEICKIDYNDEGFVNCGSIKLKGNIKDQYSIDEKDGILRVFTSNDSMKQFGTDNSTYEILGTETGINASLYCIDVKTMKTVAAVERFAPAGEDVKSARFDGDTAYVCTSVKFTDPVFFFDLSDLKNITYKETGNIEGYSTSLVDWQEGYLLGIGLKDWSTPKIEIYKEEGEKVVSVSAIGISDSSISQDYKAYYIDRERGYIGLGVYKHDRTNYDTIIQYVIFGFKNETLTVSYELLLEKGCDINAVRATYIDGYIYVLSQNAINVISESELG